MSEFDDLGQLYEETFELPWRRYLEVPTVFGLLGDLTGKSVLDFGSGSGWYCPRLVRQGADRVVGLDVSSGMVEYAGKHNADPRVEYVLGDLPTGLRGQFDIVLSVYVFGYAATREQLDGLCRASATALKPGGRLLLLTLNPDYPDDPDYYAAYGFRVRSTQPRTDGAQAALEVRFGEHDATLTVTQWSRATLAAALRSAGFDDPADRHHQLDPRGRQEHGAEFWRAYLERPHVIILDCRLPAPISE